MISLTGAALFLIQLLVVCQVFAEILPQIPSFVQRNILVPRGDSIILTCNISEANVTQINWTKGRSVFAHSVLCNQISSNFTSHYIIDLNLPSKLNIPNVQHDDAGLYRCDLTDRTGQRTIEWNLTVSEKPEGTSLARYFPYILTAVIGLLLCVFTSAVCLYRKLRARTSDQSPAQEQFHLQSETEVALRHPRGGADSRANKHRSQYMERLNSIYNL
ncbi:uncharacterized protein LOC125900035 [Epinephelus fuscoguttatus]|uniref:uncharacterized protein LOC125900035 n=1 Tax=Epinephelus fuscoguttatus TaxID=293821 RepID=UPI0020D01626|nr:uncharacterized protein LOC125900035 [Epinephelus fuscoguttatus]